MKMKPEIMNPEETKRELKARANEVESFLLSISKTLFFSSPSRLKEAMIYSLQAGGKRIRPVLFLTCASLCGLGKTPVLPFAAAIEMIHTYSLIHDDLPAMDNDDFRRGKPASHKAFGEATAILAGDGLLTDAFRLMCETNMPAAPLLEAIRRFAQAAGSCGMVGGQMLDMDYTGLKDLDLYRLEKMQAAKTGEIITASCVCGAILAQSPEELLISLENYGSALGLAFQIMDDILDITSSSEILGKPARSDEKSGKNTWPSIIGLYESKKAAREESEKAIEAIKNFSGRDAAFLRGLAAYVVGRSA